MGVRQAITVPSSRSQPRSRWARRMAHTAGVSGLRSWPVTGWRLAGSAPGRRRVYQPIPMDIKFLGQPEHRPLSLALAWVLNGSMREMCPRADGAPRRVSPACDHGGPSGSLPPLSAGPSPGPGSPRPPGPAPAPPPPRRRRPPSGAEEGGAPEAASPPRSPRHLWPRP